MTRTAAPHPHPGATLRPATPTALDWRRFAVLLRPTREGGGIVPPSYRELAEAWGIRSTSMVKRQIEAFEAVGLLRRLRARARAIEITRHLAPARDRNGDVVFLPEPSQRRTT